MIARSLDGGGTFRDIRRVNTNPEPLRGGRGVDQFMPGVAVDSGGRVGVCWYDRRNDPANFSIDRFCGISINGGLSFTQRRQTTTSWLPFIDIDINIASSYMGDYDAVTSDSLGTTPGFLGAYQIFSLP